jgi:hypothetical protein
MRLCADLALLPLDDEVIAFSERSQCLVGLNSSAAFLVQQLQNGMAASELANHVAAAGSVTIEEVSGWIASMLQTLATSGMIQGGPATAVRTVLDENEHNRSMRAAQMPRFVPFEPVAEKHYRLLNLCARIRFARLDQVPRVDSVIGHLETRDECSPSLTIDIDGKEVTGAIRSYVYAEGKAFNYVTGLHRLAPVVKGLIWESAVNAHDFRFYFHAGVVGDDRSCILLPAAAGSGKSSLTAALTHRGFNYFSDEVALVENGTFQVPPVPLAFCIKNTGWSLISRYFPQLLQVQAHERMDAKIVRYLDPHRAGVAVAQISASVSHIVFPRYDGAASTELTPMPRAEALRRMMAECLALRERLTRENVEDLIDWISNIDCYKLVFSSLDEACDRIDHVVAGH